MAFFSAGIPKLAPMFKGDRLPEIAEFAWRCIRGELAYNHSFLQAHLLNCDPAIQPEPGRDKPLLTRYLDSLLKDSHLTPAQKCVVEGLCLNIKHETRNNKGGRYCLKKVTSVRTNNGILMQDSTLNAAGATLNIGGTGPGSRTEGQTKIGLHVFDDWGQAQQTQVKEGDIPAQPSKKGTEPKADRQENPQETARGNPSPVSAGPSTSKAPRSMQPPLARAPLADRNTNLSHSNSLQHPSPSHSNLLQPPADVAPPPPPPPPQQTQPVSAPPIPMQDNPLYDPVDASDAASSAEPEAPAEDGVPADDEPESSNSSAKRMRDFKRAGSKEHEDWLRKRRRQEYKLRRRVRHHNLPLHLQGAALLEALTGLKPNNDQENERGEEVDGAPAADVNQANVAEQGGRGYADDVIEHGPHAAEGAASAEPVPGRMPAVSDAGQHAAAEANGAEDRKRGAAQHQEERTAAESGAVHEQGSKKDEEGSSAKEPAADVIEVKDAPEPAGKIASEGLATPSAPETEVGAAKPTAPAPTASFIGPLPNLKDLKARLEKIYASFPEPSDAHRQPESLPAPTVAPAAFGSQRAQPSSEPVVATVDRRGLVAADSRPPWRPPGSKLRQALLPGPVAVLPLPRKAVPPASGRSAPPAGGPASPPGPKQRAKSAPGLVPTQPSVSKPPGQPAVKKAPSQADANIAPSRAHREEAGSGALTAVKKSTSLKATGALVDTAPAPVSTKQIAPLAHKTVIPLGPQPLNPAPPLSDPTAPEGKPNASKGLALAGPVPTSIPSFGDGPEIGEVVLGVSELGERWDGVMRALRTNMGNGTKMENENGNGNGGNGTGTGGNRSGNGKGISGNGTGGGAAEAEQPKEEELIGVKKATEIEMPVEAAENDSKKVSINQSEELVFATPAGNNEEMLVRGATLPPSQTTGAEPEASTGNASTRIKFEVSNDLSKELASPTPAGNNEEVLVRCATLPPPQTTGAELEAKIEDGAVKNNFEVSNDPSKELASSTPAGNSEEFLVPSAILPPTDSRGAELEAKTEDGAVKSNYKLADEFSAVAARLQNLRGSFPPLPVRRTGDAAQKGSSLFAASPRTTSVVSPALKEFRFTNTSLPATNPSEAASAPALAPRSFGSAMEPSSEPILNQDQPGATPTKQLSKPAGDKGAAVTDEQTGQLGAREAKKRTGNISTPLNPVEQFEKLSRSQLPSPVAADRKPSLGSDTAPANSGAFTGLNGGIAGLAIAAGSEVDSGSLGDEASEVHHCAMQEVQGPEGADENAERDVATNRLELQEKATVEDDGLSEWARDSVGGSLSRRGSGFGGQPNGGLSADDMWPDLVKEGFVPAEFADFGTEEPSEGIDETCSMEGSPYGGLLERIPSIDWEGDEEMGEADDLTGQSLGQSFGLPVDDPFDGDWQVAADGLGLDVTGDVGTGQPENASGDEHPGVENASGNEYPGEEGSQKGSGWSASEDSGRNHWGRELTPPGVGRWDHATRKAMNRSLRSFECGGHFPPADGGEGSEASEADRWFDRRPSYPSLAALGKGGRPRESGSWVNYLDSPSGSGRTGEAASKDPENAAGSGGESKNV